ncbi:TlpA disulfide reductase family protein [Thalassotalea sp. 1_MG-2023]|uniref:TlpA disulfide reductase family protein n=1 Tax=Thalassotalea sp. 1_MG-2023 TaxID=3062680 RepID=UPI0026E3A51F|nr:TlpA disulfide reductase family protein [Thalassotalea sp. 1_MG-2023]MDO6425561.1 TlpA disulfide reductase family protein [Thalassotalea sp. 1_MG-2023]
MKKIFFLLLLLSNVSFSQASNSLEKFKQEVNQLKGDVVLIDFWASWCIPCKDSFPWLNELQTTYQHEGFTVLSVNLDARKQNATEFLQQYPASFPVLYDPKGKVAKAFKLKGMPSSILLNRDGSVVSRHIGFNEQKKEQYQQEIIQLLLNNPNDN